MRGADSKKVKKELAQRYGLTLQQVEEITKSPFEFQVDVMKTKCEKFKLVFPTVRILGFGMFFFPDSSRKTLERINKEREENGITGAE